MGRRRRTGQWWDFYYGNNRGLFGLIEVGKEGEVYNKVMAVMFQ